MICLPPDRHNFSLYWTGITTIYVELASSSRTIDDDDYDTFSIIAINLFALKGAAVGSTYLIQIDYGEHIVDVHIPGGYIICN